MDTCHKHGVHVTEMMIGYDGIALVQGRLAAPIAMTTQAMFLALAKLVPSQDGRHLIANPYHYWDDIDATLPHRVIRVFGPPKTAGTRDVFDEKVMDVVSLNIKAYQAAGYHGYHEIREDGVFISDGEDHQKVIPILRHDREALAFFGYGIYYKNRRYLALNRINGYELNAENVASMAYPLSRPLYFYIKRSHMSESKDMQVYVKAMLSDEMIGEQGVCVQQGLIPLPGSIRGAYRLWLKYGFELSNDNLVINSNVM